MLANLGLALPACGHPMISTDPTASAMSELAQVGIDTSSKIGSFLDRLTKALPAYTEAVRLNVTRLLHVVCPVDISHMLCSVHKFVSHLAAHIMCIAAVSPPHAVILLVACVKAVHACHRAAHAHFRQMSVDLKALARDARDRKKLLGTSMLLLSLVVAASMVAPAIMHTAAAMAVMAASFVTGASMCSLARGRRRPHQGVRGIFSVFSAWMVLCTGQQLAPCPTVVCTDGPGEAHAIQWHHAKPSSSSAPASIVMVAKYSP